MRVGINPQKLLDLKLVDAYHHVIIPVHIPELKEYYLYALDSLKLCIDSLLRTIHEKTILSIINNGSCKEVIQYLRDLKDNGYIYSLIDYQINQGKVDPIVAVMKGCREPFITVSDCDVLFTEGWQIEVEKIFSIFPKVGFVSPLPQPSLAYYHTPWSWYYGLTRNCIKRIELPDIESLISFKKSIGVEAKLNAIERNPFVLEKDGCIAILGAGHFCGTFSKYVIPFLPDESAGPKFFGAVEAALDKSIAKSGLLRLATARGWVYHIGNIPENWMYSLSKIPQKSENQFFEQIKLKRGFSIRYLSFLSRLLSHKKLLTYIIKLNFVLKSLCVIKKNIR